MNLPLPVAVAIMLGVGAAMLVLMWLGWRRRGRRSASLVGELPSVPPATSLGAPRTEPVAATYVSSTTSGDWLARVVASDLGVRSSAVVQVFDAGVLIERGGAADVFVPVAAVRGVTLSPGMAGKYVGKDGLVVLSWATPAPDGSTTLLDTGLRVARADRAVLVAAVGSLTSHQSSGTPAGTHIPDSQNDPEESE